MRRVSLFSFILCAVAAVASASLAQDRILEISYTPTGRAQIAIWVTRADGTYLRTLRLTQSVSTYGIGNRPGASQMNSGFRWPYGRREGVLPVWAHARASAPGAEMFRRVIFQDRLSEGFASRTASDFSQDTHFCLQWDTSTTRRDALDAVTCASVFNSDKGRYVTDADVDNGYYEPADMGDGNGSVPRPLDPWSLYPPRRDVMRCSTTGCFDHPDVALYRDDARRVMPEIDAATMATPPADMLQQLNVAWPAEWEDGDYILWIEVNTEGDYNASWELPTPANPDPGSPDAEMYWDYWALTYGYPYRGQPSIVYRVPFTMAEGTSLEEVSTPAGYGSIHGWGPGADSMQTMDGSITDDPATAPGSGADRLRERDGYRVRVRTQVCIDNQAPGEIAELAVTPYHERREAHRFARLSFRAPADDQGIGAYEVRVSADPIVDAESFDRGSPALAAQTEPIALMIDPSVAPGELVEVDVGGLAPLAHYFVAVRATDRCAGVGPIAVTEYTTPSIQFTTVSPCFVATAAYGTPLADEIGALRRFRDRHLRSNALGRAVVSAYEAIGPSLADAIREDEDARTLVRGLLAPIVALVRELD